MNARTYALDWLTRSRRKEAHAGVILDEGLSRAQLSAEDRRLATTLFLGSLRREATLDTLVRPGLRLAMADIQPPQLVDMLRLGAYQIACLTQIPRYAAVSATVDLARSIEPRAVGFLNGVLRRVSELVDDERLDLPAADALPMDDGAYRRLTRPVFPDPAREAVPYLRHAFGWPEWLGRRRLRDHGWRECLRQAFYFLTHPPLTLRVNARQGTRDAYLAELQAKGVTAEAGQHPQAVRLSGHVHVRQLPGYEEGRFCVQDESSIRVASALAPKPGMRVLDLCAAPGGKSTHLAELMGDSGEVVACDVDPDRLGTVRQLAERLKLSSVKTHLITDADPPPAGPFDAVLVDAPCSNTGVMGRRPELRNRIKETELPFLVRKQSQLFEQAADRLRPGGVMVYSTCSNEPEECNGVVRTMLALRPPLELEAEEMTLPGRPSDGGYWARVRKRG